MSVELATRCRQLSVHDIGYYEWGRRVMKCTDPVHGTSEIGSDHPGARLSKVQTAPLPGDGGGCGVGGGVGSGRIRDTRDGNAEIQQKVEESN